jgi:putative SOS response-associated peptidase YedK
MCGRIAQFTPSARLARYFEAELADGVAPESQAGWNVGPTRDIAGITASGSVPEHGGGTARILDLYRWGLIPNGARHPSAASQLFSARAESVPTRSSFRDAFRHQRIVIPTDGFFEWHKQGRRRQPYFFHRADGAPLALAGLWDTWEGRLRGEDRFSVIRSCTIITTRAGQDMDGIHDRMPVVLDPSVLNIWLEPDNEHRRQLQALLRPPGKGILVHHPVDPRVSNVRNDDPGVIRKVPVGSGQPS